MGFADKYSHQYGLHIPFPSWAKEGEVQDDRDFENWKELQRWADRLVALFVDRVLHDSMLITSAIPETTVTSTGQTFLDSTFDVAWDGEDTIYVSGKNDGTGTIAVDDEIVIDVTHADGSTTSFTHDFGSTAAIVPAGPFDLTSYFEPGINSTRVRLRDKYGGSYESTEIWLVQI